jgi:hypothetical protein
MRLRNTVESHTNKLEIIAICCIMKEKYGSCYTSFKMADKFVIAKGEHVKCYQLQSCRFQLLRVITTIIEQLWLNGCALNREDVNLYVENFYIYIYIYINILSTN